MSQFSQTYLALVLLLVPAGCKDKADKSAPPDDASVAVAPIVSRTADAKSHDVRPPHFTFFTAARNSLLFADIIGTQHSLRWVRHQDEQTPSPEKWSTHQENLRTIAAEVEGSESIALLAGALARFAGTCGACHVDLGAAPVLKISEPDHRGMDFRDHMTGHQRALDKMWAGLATPSDALWREGATLLADAPTHLRSLSAYGDDADEAMELAAEVHGLAAGAKTISDTEERVSMFARFLTACAECHKLPGSRPKALETVP